MSGFGASKLNAILRDDSFIKMRDFVVTCCNLMSAKSIETENFLPNHEDKIKNKLVFEYLNSNTIREDTGYKEIKLAFDAEVSGNYNNDTNTTNARFDIKVTSEDTLSYSEKYYNIECKRIDGKAHLNKEYIKEGVARFVSKDAKYSSGYGKNMMLGFVVEDINIKENTEKIDKIQATELKECIKNGFTVLEEKTKYFVYTADYYAPSREVELQHVFYNFSLAIE